MDHAFGVASKKSSSYPRSSRFSPMLSYRSSIVLCFTFRSMIHLELILWKMSSLKLFASMFLRDFGLYFSLIVMPLSGFGITVNFGFIEWIRKYFLHLHILKEIVENWHNLFLRCLTDFTSEPIWACCFQFGKIINFWLSLFNR